MTTNSKKRNGSHIPDDRPFKRQKINDPGDVQDANVIEYKNYLHCLLKIILMTINSRESIMTSTKKSLPRIDTLEGYKMSTKKALDDDVTLPYELLKNAAISISYIPVQYKRQALGDSHDEMVIFKKYLSKKVFGNRREYKNVPFILSQEARYIEYQKKITAHKNKEIGYREVIVLSSDSETEEINNALSVSVSPTNEEASILQTVSNKLCIDNSQPKQLSLEKELSEMKQNFVAAVSANETLTNELSQKIRKIEQLENDAKKCINEMSQKHQQIQQLQKHKQKSISEMLKKELEKEELKYKLQSVIVEKNGGINEQNILKLKEVTEENTTYKHRIKHLEQRLKQTMIARNKLQIIASALQSQMIKGHEPRREFIVPVKCNDGIERTATVKQWKNELTILYANILISKHNDKITKSLEKKIETFLNINITDTEYTNPMITMSLSLNDMFERFTIKLPHRCPALEGQYGVCAKMDIPKETILARYIGFEMTNKEWNNCFDYSNKDGINGQYLYSFDLNFDEENINDENKKCVTIDPIEGGKQKLLVLYINDCRKDIFTDELTYNDRKHQNCKFLVVKIKGWPTVFIQTTKKIKKRQELLLDYGKDFWYCIKENNRWNKIIEKVKKVSQENIIQNMQIHNVYNGAECHDLTQ